MSRPITDVTIVGGGTAGWLTAAYLNYWLQFSIGRREGMHITLIEAPDVPTIGVGEASVPTLRATLKLLEIDEDEFVARTDATFKLGVRFDGWDRDEQGRRSSFFHPFGGGLEVRGRNPGKSLLAHGIPAGLRDLSPTFVSMIGHHAEAADQRKGPRKIGGAPFSGPAHYAYHLDAGRFAGFLQEVAVGRGVEHVRDKVIGAERDERGNIAALQLERGGRRPVELVIDCTGFSGLLIHGVMGEPFVSFSDYLFNDRAIPVQIEHAREPDLYPATVSTALSSGWSWRIPLQSRIGTGYVYSSRFIGDQSAQEELLAHLGDAVRITEPRVIKVRVGHSARSWVGNCVAIGLSSGFLEPLESTAIQFIETSCRRLLQSFPTTLFEPQLAAKFNDSVARQYREVRDFLSLHFTLSNRTDSAYWIAMRDEAKRSDEMNALIDQWRHLLPDAHDTRSAEIFTFWSIAAVLFGKGFYRGPVAAGSDVLPALAWENFLHQWRGLKSGVLAALPDHGELLQSMCESAIIGGTATRPPRPSRIMIGGDALTMPTTVMSPAEFVRSALPTGSHA